MKKILLSFTAIFFPWIIFLIKDNPGSAIVALVMQATLIGWPFASMWAMRSLNQNEDDKDGE